MLQLRHDLEELRGLRRYLYFLAVLLLISTAVISWETFSDRGAEWADLQSLARVGTGTSVVLAILLVVDRWPLETTLGLAVVTTATYLYEVLTEGFKLSEGGIYHLIITIYIWMIVSSAHKLTRKRDEEPESFTARMLRGEGAGEADDYRARSLEENKRRKRIERNVILLLFAVLVALMALGLSGSLREA